jgi:sulfate permease, SulP family
VGAIRASATGTTPRSRAARTDTETAELDADGSRLHVLMLQGYLFFGTAQALLLDVRARLSGAPPARSAVLDFRHVDGLDSSAVQSFQKLRSMAKAAGSALVLTDLPRHIERLFARAHLLDEPDERGAVVRVRPDLDRGLELCEDEILAAKAAGPKGESSAAAERAARARLERLLEAIEGHAERVEIDPGEELYREGAPSDDLVIVESEELTAFITSGAREKRLRAMGRGVSWARWVCIWGRRSSGASPT